MGSRSTPSYKIVGRAVHSRAIFDASAAPRGQLPYIFDDGETIGDSEAGHVTLEIHARETCIAVSALRAPDGPNVAKQARKALT